MPSGVPKCGYRIRNGKKVYVKGGLVQPTVEAVMHAQPIVPVVFETDDQILARIKSRFEAMDMLAEETIYGRNKSLIISGPAGLGKSYGVMAVAKEAEKMNRQIVDIKGNVGATGLYRTLWENRFPTNAIVFDDADAIFNDEVSLGILKAACDMTEARYINWLKELKMTDDDGARLPRRFEFEGSVVFITNYDFNQLIAKGNRIAPHLEAMMSRSMYLDLTLKTPRDHIIRIKQVMYECGMISQLGLSKEHARELIGFMEEHMNELLELSLRMVIKLSSLMNSNKVDWKNLAKITCFKL